MAQLGCEGCDQLSQCHTKKLMGDWWGLQPCPMCLLPVQPSCLPNSCLRLIEVIEWIQGEDLGKCLPRAKHHLQCQCCTGHQPLQVTVTGCSWLVKESHITDHIIWIQLLTSTHTMLPSLQNQHQEELAPIHLCLPTFPIPRHSLTQGRWGFGLTPPWGHPLPPRHWNTGKYRSTKTLVWSQGSITVFLRDICLTAWDGVYYWGAVTLWDLQAIDSLHPSQRDREQLTPPYSWSYSPPLLACSLPLSFFIAVVEYNQHIYFFSRQPLRDRKTP